MNPVSAAIAFILLPPILWADPQAAVSIAEVRSILREASSAIGKSDSTTASNIASAQMEAGDVDGANETLRGLSQNAPVGGAAGWLAKQGRLPQALAMIESISDGQNRAVACWQIALSLADVARYSEALSVARLIEKDPTQISRFIDTLMLIYAAQRKAGDQEGAAATLNEALEVVDHQPEIPSGTYKPQPSFLVYSYRPRMYQVIVHAVVLAASRADAQPAMTRISAMAAQQRDPEKLKGILWPLAYAQADMGDFPAALKTAAQVDSLVSSVVMREIAVEQARHGDATGALATAKAEPGAIREVVRALAESGNYARARVAIDLLHGPDERAEALSDLAFRQADRNPSEARSSADLAWTEAQRAKGTAPPYDYENALEFIAATRARLGDIEGAMEIIGDGFGLQRKSWPLENVVQRLVRDGKKDQALELSRTQSQRGLRELPAGGSDFVALSDSARWSLTASHPPHPAKIETCFPRAST